jgi:hypothetical protein
MKILPKAIVPLILFVGIISAQQVSNFSKKGSSWLGGGLNYSSIGIEGESDRLSMLQVSPILRFFPADHFMIGPNISWTGIFVEGESVNQFGIGLEIGGVFDGGGKTFPYVRSGGSLAILGAGGESATGFSLPLAAGIIIPVGRVFALQIEPAYTITWVENSSMNVFSLSFGICGIGEKSAVTVMQGMSGLTSLF